MPQAAHSRRVGVAHPFSHAPGVVGGQGLNPRHRDDVELEARREEMAKFPPEPSGLSTAWSSMKL
jgi:hypothetical protein